MFSRTHSADSLFAVASLYSLKYWYTRRLGFLIQGSVRRGISPDAWTAVGVLSAALGCGALVMGWWVPALILLAARLGGANLDGAVARARGVSRPFGFVLNEIGDRVSDLFIMAGLVGLALRIGAPPSTVALTLIALTAATLPTFISLAAAGAGAARLNGGPFGKTERCLAAVVAAALPQYLTRHRLDHRDRLPADGGNPPGAHPQALTGARAPPWPTRWRPHRRRTLPAWDWDTTTPTAHSALQT